MRWLWIIALLVVCTGCAELLPSDTMPVDTEPTASPTLVTPPAPAATEETTDAVAPPIATEEVRATDLADFTERVTDLRERAVAIEADDLVQRLDALQAEIDAVALDVVNYDLVWGDINAQIEALGGEVYVAERRADS